MLVPAVQVLRAVNTMFSGVSFNDDLMRKLFCADPRLFRTHLQAHVKTMAPHGFLPAALGALAARDFRLLLREPDWLAVQFEMLRTFFAPHGDAPAVIMRMTKSLRACLPAMVQHGPLDTKPVTARKNAMSCLHKAFLAGPTHVLSWTRQGLKQHLRMLVAIGLFDDAAHARQGCMLRPELLKSRQLSWFLRRKAAVLTAGGSMDDVLAACCVGGNQEAAYPCLLLWKQLGCAAACSTSANVTCTASSSAQPSICAVKRSVASSQHFVTDVLYAPLCICVYMLQNGLQGQSKSQGLVIRASHRLLRISFTGAVMNINMDAHPRTSAPSVFPCKCRGEFPLHHCFHSQQRVTSVARHGTSDKGAWFTERLATAEGQAELHAFVQRIERRLKSGMGRSACAPDPRCVLPNTLVERLMACRAHVAPATLRLSRPGVHRLRSLMHVLGAEQVQSADDLERKVALLLEHGLRTDRPAAQKFAASSPLRSFTVADYQHRIELLRMYGCPLDKVTVTLFRRGLATRMLPLLAFLDKHACDLP